MSRFADWFEAQHGPRESHRYVDVADDVLNDQVAVGRGAKNEMVARRRWDARYESALYAWQVRNKT